VSVGVALFCVGLAFVGAAVQASVGLGFGLLATPLLAMVDTDFVPGAVLVAIIPLTLSVSIGSFADIDHRGAGLAVLGRVPGVVLGTVVVATVSDRSIAIGLAVAVLLAVAMSVWLPTVAVTPGRTIAAGTVSGFMGTTTGVGGPPMALLFQRMDPRTVRATLSAYFFAGTLLSILSLTIAGELGTRQWRLALLLLPGVVAGVLASRRLRPYLTGHWFRPTLLALCAASATVLLIQEL
jgi:uncharacterized membrane protein YfcA